MSVKNEEVLKKRREYVVNEIHRRTHEKLEYVVNDIADRLFLHPRTIYRDLMKARDENSKR